MICIRPIVFLQCIFMILQRESRSTYTIGKSTHNSSHIAIILQIIQHSGVSQQNIGILSVPIRNNPRQPSRSQITYFNIRAIRMGNTKNLYLRFPIHFNQINALYETPEHLSWVYKPAHFS